jgi:hypothetical protein
VDEDENAPSAITLSGLRWPETAGRLLFELTEPHHLSIGGLALSRLDLFDDAGRLGVGMRAGAMKTVFRGLPQN